MIDEASAFGKALFSDSKFGSVIAIEAKQSIDRQPKDGLLRRCVPRNDGE
jgi:hypothetical protein